MVEYTMAPPVGQREGPRTQRTAISVSSHTSPRW